MFQPISCPILPSSHQLLTSGGKENEEYLTRSIALHLMKILTFQGYEGSLLKVTSKNGKTSSPVGFVTFTTRAGAEAAKLDLQQGVRFDPDLPQTIRLEFAKSNTKVSKPKQPSPPAAPTHPGLLHPITGQEMGALLPAVPDGWPHHPLSYTEVPVSTALHSAAIVHPALHAQLPPPLTVPHPIPHAAMHHPSQMPPPPPPHFVANHATAAAPNSTPPPTQPQPPQCSTLFVANLGHFVQEQELKDIYGRWVKCSIIEAPKEIQHIHQ
ncbi:protein couch potato [Trichonephila clavata]|uniref:Protein couch potato n=1 Tax=Trichonephila clavata TaxID=2740835 RepID=A0A8X6F307_TRICU|nr:protein couch potato [Trichonephila clavata]